MTTAIVDLVGLMIVVVFAIIGYHLWDKRYRGETGGNFKPTNEVFKDPTTGKMTRVYEDPSTGKRQYREEGT